MNATEGLGPLFVDWVQQNDPCSPIVPGIRRARPVSMRALGKLLGTSGQYVQQLSSGQANPTMDAVVKYLGTLLDYGWPRAVVMADSKTGHTVIQSTAIDTSEVHG